MEFGRLELERASFERTRFERIGGVVLSRRDVLRGFTFLSLGAAAAMALPRSVLAAANAIGATAGTAGAAAAAAGAGSHASTGAPVRIESFAPSGASLGTESVSKVVKTEAQWRAQLTPISFEITRRAGTERPDVEDHDHPNGLYRCICCDTALYDSRTKFESGTGWPSFYQPISKLNVVESADHTFGMERIAVSCRRCDAHLGHVFDDGPKPTGLRYCMNGVAMRFVPRAA